MSVLQSLLTIAWPLLDYIIQLLFMCGWCRGQKARGVETPIYEASSGNPFAERPSTARQRDQHNKSTELALAELDKESNAPDGKCTRW